MVKNFAKIFDSSYDTRQEDALRHSAIALIYLTKVSLRTYNLTHKQAEWVV